MSAGIRVIANHHVPSWAPKEAQIAKSNAEGEYVAHTASTQEACVERNIAKEMNMKAAVASTCEASAVAIGNEKEELDEFDISNWILRSSEKLVETRQVDVDECPFAGNPANGGDKRLP